MRRHLVLIPIAAVALALPAAARPAAAQAPQLTVLAAASLREAFPVVSPTQRFSFAGSDTLAAQIRQGAPADVFASANTSLPDALYAEKRVEKPVVFATNRLVLLVPASNPAGISSVFDLRRSGIRLVVGGATVPIGVYTRDVLRRLGMTSALRNVVSNERDVAALTAKVALGEADAGFAYVTDAKAVGNRVRTIPIPAWAQPRVRYGIAVVRSSTHLAAARAFVKKVLSTSGRKALRDAGFGLPPLPKKPAPKKT